MIVRCCVCHAIYAVKCPTCPDGGKVELLRLVPLEWECCNHEPEGCVFRVNHDVVTDGYCAICLPLEQAAIAEARVN